MPLSGAQISTSEAIDDSLASHISYRSKDIFEGRLELRSTLWKPVFITGKNLQFVPVIFIMMESCSWTFLER